MIEYDRDWYADYALLGEFSKTNQKRDKFYIYCVEKDFGNKFKDQVKALSDKELLHSMFNLARGDDSNGYFTDLGGYIYDLLCEELSQRFLGENCGD